MPRATHLDRSGGGGGAAARVWLAALLAILGSGCFERGRDGDEGEGVAALVARARAGAEVTPEAAPADVVEPTTPIDPSGVIRIALEAEPPHLDPMLTADAVAARVVVGDVYEGLLCSAGPGAEPQRCLAEEVEVDGDGGRFTFRLREGVRFHDGRPLTAADVRFSFERARDPALSWLAGELDDLRRVDASDARTIRLEFAGPRPGRRELFTRIPILPRAHFADPAAAAAAGRAPIGTGPLRVERWQTGEEIRLRRFDGYWGAPAPAAEIRYRIHGDRQQVLHGLAVDELDLALQIPADEAARAVRAHRHLRAFRYQLPAYLAAVYNPRHAALAEVEVRQALTQALDRFAIARSVLGDPGAVVSGPFLPGSPAENPAIRPWPFDLEAAARVLGARRLTLTVLVPAGSRTMARIADIWSADARAHATLRIETIPYADLLARLREGRFDIALLAFTSARDLDLYGRFHSSQHGVENYGAFSDPALDHLLEAARAEADELRRGELQRRIHARLHHLQPYAFIGADARVGLANERIGGLRPPAQGLAARSLRKHR